MADLTTEDLRAADAAGMIDERAAARLTAFADEREGRRALMPQEDEPFEFFRGFGEIFIAVGLLLFFGALHALGLVMGGAWDGKGPGGFTSGLGLAAAWALAVYFTRRRRMSLPSIVLACVFAIDLASVLAVMLYRAFGGLFANVAGQGSLSLLALAALGVGGMAIYYRVFRLPFALLPLGLFGLVFAMATARWVAPWPVGRADFPVAVFDLAQSPTISLGMLAFGLAAFLVAMRFDMRDPHRLGRHAASAFWLHILAAPALVNTVCLTLYNMGGVLGYVATAAGFFLMALLALVIDRRSFLMAGVVYAGLALGAAFEAAGGDNAFGAILTVGLLGGGITLLGAHWARARASVMRALPNFAIKRRLPPY